MLLASPIAISHFPPSLTSKSVDGRPALLHLSNNTRRASCRSHHVCKGLERTGSLRVGRWRFCFVVLCASRGFALGVSGESALGLVLELGSAVGRLGNYLLAWRIGGGGSRGGELGVGVGDGRLVGLKRLEDRGRSFGVEGGKERRKGRRRSEGRGAGRGFAGGILGRR